LSKKKDTKIFLFIKEFKFKLTSICFISSRGIFSSNSSRYFKPSCWVLFNSWSRFGCERNSSIVLIFSWWTSLFAWAGLNIKTNKEFKFEIFSYPIPITRVIWVIAAPVSSPRFVSNFCIFPVDKYCSIFAWIFFPIPSFWNTKKNRRFYFIFFCIVNILTNPLISLIVSILWSTLAIELAAFR